MKRIPVEYVIMEFIIKFLYEKNGKVYRDKVKINALYKQQAINAFENWITNIKNIYEFYIISIDENKENRQYIKYTEDDI